MEYAEGGSLLSLLMGSRELSLGEALSLSKTFLAGESSQYSPYEYFTCALCVAIDNRSGISPFQVHCAQRHQV